MEFSRIKSSKFFLVISAVSILIALFTVNASGSVDTITSGNSAFSDLITGKSSASPDPEVAETDTVALQKGLQGYWRFDNPEVSRGYSLEFDGSNDHVNISSSPKLTGYDKFTVSIWAKSGNWEPFFCKSGQHRIRYRTNPNDFAYSTTFNTTGATVNSRENLTDDKWYHLVMRYDGKNFSGYLNAEKQQSTQVANASVVSNSNDFVLGAQCSLEYFNGRSIDDVRVYNRSLSSSEIQNLYDERPVSREGLVLHQDFNEGPKNCELTSGDSCLSDDSGNSNDGTPYGFDDNSFDTGSGWLDETPLNRPKVKEYSQDAHIKTYGGNNGALESFKLSKAWSEGYLGNTSLKFDGVDDRVRVSSRPSLRINSSLSLSAWIKTDNSSDTRGIIDTQESGERGYRITVENGELEFGVYAGDIGKGQTELRGNTMIADGSWHHVVGSWDGNRMEVYVDGELESTATQPAIAVSNQDLFLGVRDVDNGWFDGKIDDARVYDRSLSKAEVNSLYNRESVTEDLVGRWNFEAGDRKTAYDASFQRKGILASSGAGLKGVSMEGVEDFGVDQKITISSWIKPEGSKSVSGGNDTYYVKDNGTICRVHAFTETGDSTLKVESETVEADLLVVAGGGGGGGSGGGGGGAGGLKYREDFQLNSDNYSVHVGSGGAGGEGESLAAEGGENSSFANIETLGGGGGGTRNIDNGHNGGSGGGGNKQSMTSGGNGTSGQGYDGGDGQNYGNCGAAGGGGGAGERGGDQRGEGLGGHGGKGVYFGDAFGEAYGEEGWFAGGGGGSLEGDIDYMCNVAPGDGGKGGGGDGSAGNPGAENGLKNTGGGGGGGNQGQGGDENLYQEGGNGGSGIVLVRYPVSEVISVKGGSYSLGYDDGKLISGLGNSTLVSSMKPRSWQQVGLTFDGSEQKVFINGKERNSAQVEQYKSTESDNIVVGENFEGMIDETRIYNRILSNKEIRRLNFQ